MRLRARLIFLALAFACLMGIGRWASGGFGFVLTEFWFTSGFFLLLLLSLVDQPYFSKDGNVFLNGVTGWISLLLVPASTRGAVWWIFFTWSAYLIVSSFVLMWVRTRALGEENPVVQAISRVNRQIGRPEAIFSAFLLWGAIEQFGFGSRQLAAIFLFWAVFIILNFPALAHAIDALLSPRREEARAKDGVLDRLISPRVADSIFPADLPVTVIGKAVNIRTVEGDAIGDATVIDDRSLGGRRQLRLALDSSTGTWARLSNAPLSSTRVHLDIESPAVSPTPISVVDSGSDIEKIVLSVHPDVGLEAGDVLSVTLPDQQQAYFQAVSATVTELTGSEGNSLHSVRVVAGQLGRWDRGISKFEPINWVAPAGALAFRVDRAEPREVAVPNGAEVVGQIPHSNFPVHVDVQDAVTHNTALIGVTGSGKSYFAFLLIEGIINRGIKVLVLDPTRQHDIYLHGHNPTALRRSADVGAWLQTESKIGIHQFADTDGYPKRTAEFVSAAYQELSQEQLQRGRDIPARLCVVFEEAHSLIPEWNQVAFDSDKREVNRTARTILQGRKYGMGAMIITQRTANVTKTILNQCNTIIALQSFDQTGLDFLRNYMGEAYSQTISMLPPRHAILVGKASSCARPVLMSILDLSDRWGRDHQPETEGAEEPSASAGSE